MWRARAVHSKCDPAWNLKRHGFAETPDQDFNSTEPFGRIAADLLSISRGKVPKCLVRLSY